MKTCSKCNIPKELNQFNKHKTSKDGLNSWCKICTNNKSKEYYILDSRKEYHRNYDSQNKEKIIDYHKEYSIINQELLKIYHQNYRPRELELNRKRYKNNPQYRLGILSRTRINQTLKDKNNTNLELIGCNKNEFKNYLESKFLPEMSWNNHGEIWEIDHIIPICNFDLENEEERLKAYNYKNQQPLFKTTKIAKQFGYNNITGNRDKNKYLEKLK